jgi:hypothetical protein
MKPPARTSPTRLNRFDDWPASGRGFAQRDLRIHPRVVRAEVEVLAQVLRGFELETEVSSALGVLERHQRLCTGVDDPLDRILKVLVEGADREHAACAREHFVARIEVLNQRATKIRVAADGAIANHVGELEEGKLAELRTIRRLAVADPDVLIGTHGVNEVDAGEDVGRFDFGGDDFCKESERILRVHLLLEVLDADTGHQARPIGQRRVGHPVGAERFLFGVVRIDGTRLFVEAEAGADIAADEQLLRSLRQVQARRARRNESEAPRTEVARAL